MCDPSRQLVLPIDGAILERTRFGGFLRAGGSVTSEHEHDLAAGVAANVTSSRCICPVHRPFRQPLRVGPAAHAGQHPARTPSNWNRSFSGRSCRTSALLCTGEVASGDLGFPTAQPGAVSPAR